MFRQIALILFVLLFNFMTNPLLAHCQVPCGIYDDQTVFKQMYVDTATIAKASQEIKKLSQEKKAINYNQIVRWVNEKDRSANNIIKTCAEYFLAQRIKSEQDDYIRKLKLLHSIILNAMKSKQSLDKPISIKLTDEIHSFEHVYNKQ